jgi:hypothetical protein
VETGSPFGSAANQKLRGAHRFRETVNASSALAARFLPDSQAALGQSAILKTLFTANCFISKWI